MNKTKNFVITINRELGSGGRTIGFKLAEKLGVKFYDKALIEALTKKFDLSLDELEKVKAEKKSMWSDFAKSYMERYNVEGLYSLDEPIATPENIFKVESKVLQDLAENESCVIAGRSGFFIFKDHPNVVRILIQSKLEKRIAHIMAKQNLSEDQARKVIAQVDKGRETYTQRFSGTSRYDTRNYDLVINVADISTDDTVDLILQYINK